jgi:hypothetical protein
MNRIKLALKVHIIVITSFITISVNTAKSHLTSQTNAETSKRNKRTDNNKIATSDKIGSKRTDNRKSKDDIPKKKGKPRIKIKQPTKHPQRHNRQINVK